MTTFLTYLLIVPLLRKKEDLRITQPNHAWVRLDRYISENSLGLLMTILPIFLLITTFFPIYILHGSSQVITVYDVATKTKLAYLPTILFVIAGASVFFRKRFAGLLYALAIVGGCVTLVFINFLATNSDIEAPEPFQTIGALAYFFAPIGASVVAYKLSRGLPKDEHSIKDEDGQMSRGLFQIIATLTPVVGYMCAAGLVMSGVILKNGMPAESLKMVTPAVFGMILFVIAGLVFIMTLLRHLNLISYTLFLYFCVIIFFVTLAPFIFLVKDNVDEGPGSGWLIMFLSVFFLLGTAGMSDGIRTRIESKELAAKTFK
jgi:hypothetical protein